MIEHLYLSPGHNFFGHHGKPAGTHLASEVGELACLAGRGVRGDRFLDYKPDYAGQITFFEAEVFEGLCAKLGLTEATPAGLRRMSSRGVYDSKRWPAANFVCKACGFAERGSASRVIGWTPRSHRARGRGCAGEGDCEPASSPTGSCVRGS